MQETFVVYLLYIGYCTRQWSWIQVEQVLAPDLRILAKETDKLDGFKGYKESTRSYGTA